MDNIEALIAHHSTAGYRVSASSEVASYIVRGVVVTARVS